MRTRGGSWKLCLLSCALLIQGLADIGKPMVWGAEAQSLTVVINRGIPLRTDTPTPTISGATDALANSQVQVTINAQTVTTSVLSGGVWNVEWPTPLAPGAYTILVRIEDPTGAVGTAVQRLEVSSGERLPRRPLGEPEQFTPAPLEESAGADFQAATDRWRIVPPPYEVNVKGSLWDPYNQNVLKGDLPIYGQDIFLNLTGVWDTLVEFRKLPTPSGVSSERPGSAQFLGNDSQFFLNQNWVVSADLFKGDTAFRPFDWRLKATLIGNINYLNVEERGIVNPDVRKGTDRLDGIPALQEAFAEAKLADLSPNFDFISVRAGIQPFNSDFKGFIFSDTNLGVRFFGNYESNRDQFNLVYFDRLEKDTNSGLNRLRNRDQRVLIANFYRQDFLVKGYTTQFSVHQLWEGKSFHFDQNHFLARPDPVGSFRPHALEATYLGWTGFGHIERINVDHAFYFTRGHDTKNPIAGRSIDIAAYMGAVELSYDRDWFRPKISYFHTSGDGDPIDGRGHGFDAIFDNPLFAGGGFSFWNRLGIKLTGTGVNLVNRGSLIPNLRSSKEEGQPNFVNPGLHLFNIGFDAELTPKLKGLVNVNYLRFDTTKPLKFLLFQSRVRDEIGWDLSLGIRYRPFLNNNVILLAGTAVFFPGEGFRDIYGLGNTIFHTFSNIILTF
ncbi:MAG TPA: Ig-like domain-containing protein [Methylomirabilota bacterium]|nr:Ig-like domain-containing protein [Methylomirabilota bacterium]